MPKLEEIQILQSKEHLAILNYVIRQLPSLQITVTENLIEEIKTAVDNALKLAYTNAPSKNTSPNVSFFVQKSSNNQDFTIEFTICNRAISVPVKFSTHEG